VKPGVPLRLVLTALGVTGRPCAPQPGAAVDIWGGDALGAYSDVLDREGLFAEHIEHLLSSTLSIQAA
jgi:protocatechuate 3,4-dioxygenase beta subunit